MRRFKLGFWLPLLLACSANNTVAGDGRSTAEQLEANAPSWCEQACQRVAQCAEGDCVCSGDVCDCAGAPARDCPGDCEALLTGYAKTSEACANVGQRLMDCVDASSCSELDEPGRCAPTHAEEDACDAEDSSEGTPSSGGTSVGDSSGPPAGGPLPSGIVTCLGGEGSGGGMPAGGGPYVSCEQAARQCSDGHDYRVLCVTSAEGVASCSCYRDEAPSGSSFQPVGGCPLVAEVNRGCGWSLATF